MNKELERIADSIANYEPEDWEEIGITKEMLQEDYNRFKDILDTLELCEMRLIWYLRNLGRGEVRRFFALAKSNYEIYQATLNLRYPNEVLENGRK